MNDDDSGTVFRDLIMLALLGFVTMVVLMLPHLYPPTEGEDVVKPAGTLIVEARWPDNLDVDVDLWVRSPGDRPVGFSRSHGEAFDLLRDDLGFERDQAGWNYEFAFCRGTPPGEYIVNVHLYSNRIAAPSVTVLVVVSLLAGSRPIEIARRDVVLLYAGQEITVVRFRLDGQAAVVPGSVHDLPMTLKGK